MKLKSTAQILVSKEFKDFLAENAPHINPEGVQKIWTKKQGNELAQELAQLVETFVKQQFLSA